MRNAHVARKRHVGCGMRQHRSGVSGGVTKAWLKIMRKPGDRAMIMAWRYRAARWPGGGERMAGFATPAMASSRRTSPWP